MVSGRIDELTSEPARLAPLSRERIRAALRPTPPPLSASEPSLRPAAVLMPIVERDEPTQTPVNPEENLVESMP